MNLITGSSLLHSFLSNERFAITYVDPSMNSPQVHTFLRNEHTTIAHVELLMSSPLLHTFLWNEHTTIAYVEILVNGPLLHSFLRNERFHLKPSDKDQGHVLDVPMTSSSSDSDDVSARSSHIACTRLRTQCCVGHPAAVRASQCVVRVWHSCAQSSLRSRCVSS